ncbi:MAG: metal-dependent transcriptional regulator [Thaumarchaeota archaeon]|nr:metal-dependent transcriptional regulator [Nitrososphaerota archaeon]
MVHRGVSGFSQGQEEFLELVYRLTASGGVARTSDLAEGLRTTLGTVTNLVERLERKGLVVHQPYRGITLTSKGKRIAAEIVKRHRLVERFLIDFLMIPSERAHKYACKMEHSLDKEVVDALASLLSTT